MATKKANRQRAVLLMTVAIILILASNAANNDRGMPVYYDGINNDFKLTIPTQYPAGIAGEPYTVNVWITEEGDGGSMYVQCSIFDRVKATFITDEMMQSRENTGRMDIVYLSLEENCGANEPYTQTLRTNLIHDATMYYPLTMLIPTTPMAEPVLYCSAYEQCWSEETPDPHYSDQVFVPFTVLGGPTINDDYVSPMTCEEDDDCTIYTDAVCANDVCIDKEDVPESWFSKFNIDFDFGKTKGAVKDWIANNEFLVITIAIVLIFIGVSSFYREPKRRRV